jgi:penicillin G amidase
MCRWGAPSVNQVYADTTGRIAWLPVGSMPLRPNWHGLLPVPGDGRYEWSGFLDPDALPWVVNPPQGFLATANELNLPPDWDHASAPVGFEWTEGSRAARIQEALLAGIPHSVGSSCALQTDDTSMPARRLLAVLRALRSKIVGEVADILLGWDARLAADSAPAALFEIWWTKHLKPALLAHAAPGEAIRTLLTPGDTETLLQLVESPDARLGPDPLAVRDRLVADTLEAALRDCIGRMGPNVSDWSWGRLHHVYFEHSLSPLASAGESFDIGPFPLGGSASTPMQAGYRPSDFRVTAGASVRIVIDVGDWDRSRCINAPGQSGDPRSSHYDDLAPLWASGEYAPLLFGRKAVDDAAQTRIELVPEGTTDASSGS